MADQDVADWSLEDPRRYQASVLCQELRQLSPRGVAQALMRLRQQDPELTLAVCRLLRGEQPDQPVAREAGE